AESNYNPGAVSAKGAIGIMQLIPRTARRFGVANPFNAEENIQGGAKYLKYLLELYHGDYSLALAAYNAGEGAVAKHGGVPPYAETGTYVKKVLSDRSLTVAAQHGAPESQPLGSGQVASEYNQIQRILEPDGTVRYVSR